MAEILGISNLEAKNTRPQNESVRFVVDLLRRLGEEEGIKVNVEEEWGYAGQIEGRSGMRYFRGSDLGLNSSGSAEIAKDKAYAADFPRRSGFNVIPGTTFFSKRHAKRIKSSRGPEAIYAHVEKMGFPIILKPNSGSLGQGVFFANSKEEIVKAIQAIFEIDDVLLVQPLVSGHDYRIVILDGELVAAYERIALSVTGDGASTIQELLKTKAQSGNKVKIDNIRIEDRLKRHGLNRSSILPNGQYFALLDNCNLATGGNAIDVTESIHPSYIELAKNIAKHMDLRFCGLDLMVADDIRKPLDPAINNYHVIELNHAARLDGFASLGERQNVVTRETYRKILKILAA